ncbi:MAG: 3-phosphoshikimate 1-carboxyvinyltransferase [Lachnospiraceae bacterium]|nr:3-phosphoshikimate 1-carboxyvinyltransferase [Lachnospiraceae bacterium]
MLTITPSHRPFHTDVTVPGDKSISHRSIMFGALAEGDTRITGFLKSADCLSTMSCFRALGIDIEETEDEILVHGKGLHGLQAPSVTLDAGNSGTTTRLMAGILSAQTFPSTLTGDASIQKRPMGRVITPLTAMGADITSAAGNDCAPLKISGGKLHGIDWTSPVASAQVKSCILLAALCSGTEASVTEPSLSRDHTERMLNAFGVPVSTVLHPDGSATARIAADGVLRSPGAIDVPGDISSAAYFLAAALLVPGSEILVRNVGINPTRAGILTVLRRMGVEIIEENRDDSLEPKADLRVRYQRPEHPERDPHGDFVIGGDIIPALIDELPMIAVLCTQLPGRSIIRDAAELKVKESDRIAVMTENLKKMGADITATDDGFVIHGPTPLYGAEIDPHLDHRIAMSLAVAALGAEGDTVIRDHECVNISYPEFFDELFRLT